MQIHELANLSGNPASGTSFVVDNGSATRKIDYTALADAILKQRGFSLDLTSTQRTTDAWIDRLIEYYGLHDDSGVHNSVFRGHELGTSVSSAQFNAINSGAFTNMYIGDYWLINNYRYRIAAFNPYYGVGSPALASNHIAVVRDESFSPRPWHSSKNTSVGYVGSSIRESLSEVIGEDPVSAVQAFVNAFGDSHVLTYKDYYAASYTDGVATAGAYVDCRVELPSEVQMFGFLIHGAPSKQMEIGNCKNQFPLFAFEHRRITGINRFPFWLRTVAGGMIASYVSGTGNISGQSVLTEARIRPFALIG